MWAEDVYPDASLHHPKYYTSIYKTPQNLKENSDGGIPKFIGIKFYLKNEHDWVTELNWTERMKAWNID